MSVWYTTPFAPANGIDRLLGTFPMGSFQQSLRDLPVVGYFLRVVYAVWKLPKLWEVLNSEVQATHSRLDWLDAREGRVNRAAEGSITQVASIVDLAARVTDLTAQFREQAADWSQFQAQLHELRRQVDAHLAQAQELAAPLATLSSATGSPAPASPPVPGQMPGNSSDNSGFVPVYLGRERLLVRTKTGQLLMCNAQDIQLTPQLINRGTWEPSLTALYTQNITPGMKYLEIGANIGYFTILASILVGHTGRVHAFEPEPDAFSLLRLNCRLNHCSYLCELIPQAVSDFDGERTLNKFEYNFGSSSLSELPEMLLKEFCEEPSQQPVKCATLDNYYRNRDIVFDFIKIDAEGAEPLIFSGAQDFLCRCTRDSTIFAVEFNPQAIEGLGQNGKQFIDHLLQTGFFIWQLSEKGELQRVICPDELDTRCNAELILSRKIDALKAQAPSAT